MFLLLIVFPVVSYPWTDPTAFLEKMGKDHFFWTVGMVATIVWQWFLFLFIWMTVWRENTGLKGIGFTKIRLIHFGWAIAFLLASNVILLGLEYILSQFGLGIPGELGFLVPDDPPRMAIWVVVSFTAGFCEETAFRGYLLTRLQKLSGTKKWLLAGIVSSVVFGLGHTYQGLGGFIVISVYGGLFALLYWRTGSLWPCIIAHSLQDLSALFRPFGQ